MAKANGGFAQKEVDCFMPVRRLQPPKGYYTASRAKRVLGGISDGMLRSYVTKGDIERIVPTGRTHGFYKIEDVHRVAEELRIFSGEPEHTIQFTRGVVEDLPECANLLASTFGRPDTTGQVIPANGIERRADWVRKNSETFYVLKADQKIVGCAFMLPLTAEKIEEILQNEITPPIYGEDILEFHPDVPTRLYVMSVCVIAADLPTKRFYGSRVVNGLLRVFVSLGRRGIPIETIVSRSDTRDGIGFLKSMGFTEIDSVTSSRNFIIEVPRSGIPSIKRYKKAFLEYQEAHKPHR